MAPAARCRAASADSAASLRLLAAAGALLVASGFALLWAVRDLTHARADTVAAVLPLILGLSVPAAAGLALSPRLARLPDRGPALLIVVLVGFALRILWLGQPGPLEDDYNRYMWDGAVLAAGLDPYAVAPAAVIAHPDAYPHYAAPRARAGSVMAAINFPEVPTIYPGTALAAFGLASLIAPFDLDGLRIVLLAAECATLALLLALLPRLGASRLHAALYWWNPLAAYMTVGIAHIDALLPPLVLAAIWLSHASRHTAALAVLGLAAGVKVWPVLLAPLMVRPLLGDPRRLLPAAAVLILVLAATLGPFLVAALRPGSALAFYVSRGTNNAAFFAWAYKLVTSLLGDPAVAWRIVSMTALLATLGTAFGCGLVSGDRSLQRTYRAALLIAAATFYLSAQQFPWYALWFLPLAALVRCRPLLLASATLPFYYLFFPLWQTGRGELFQLGAAFLHAVPVLGWLLWDKVIQRQ